MAGTLNHTPQVWFRGIGFPTKENHTTGCFAYWTRSKAIKHKELGNVDFASPHQPINGWLALPKFIRRANRACNLHERLCCANGHIGSRCTVRGDGKLLRTALFHKSVL